MKFKIILKKGDHGGYRATVPGLPGCISRGSNEAEALKQIQSEILLHLGVEDASQVKHWRDVTYYQFRLRQSRAVNMSKERKFAALTTLAGVFLMVATIWAARVLFA